MARSLNRVTLLGNIGRDAEVKQAGSGSVVQFSVATERRWKDKTSNEWKSETDWHNVVDWKAENIAQYLKKGVKVLVEGRLKTRSYEKDGNKIYVTEVVSDNVILLGDGPGKGQGNDTRESGGGSGDDQDVPF